MNHMEQNLTNETVALVLKDNLHTRIIAERLTNNHAPWSCAKFEASSRKTPWISQ